MRILSVIAVFLMAATTFAADATIFAAASTTNAMNEIIAIYEKDTGKRVTASYASSGTLAKQIDKGAPADIFLSANAKWMKWLDDKGRIENSSPLLANRLALIAPSSADVSAKSLDAETVRNLIGGGRIVMADPSHSPAGIYARKTLESLGLWESFEGQTAGLQTVRAALAMVEKNAATFGIVYSSDAALSKYVKTVGLFNEDLHGKIRYPVAVVKGKGSETVYDFHRFLSSDTAGDIFKKYGFSGAE
ncbi:molybdate ABC transporter substrate-binding protein [Limisalsivibrio acetivorans]|uniref:molybdate ABC transporter substrate-binding protein n=1 Tax=Limisalsivibrio acetivorans TaxID=1304888 RepID=UPI0003B3779A|nr:molybdate ABC transporter substrate-binding protein [Limisalsivibrio acetivorans]